MTAELKLNKCTHIAYFEAEIFFGESFQDLSMNIGKIHNLTLAEVEGVAEDFNDENDCLEQIFDLENNPNAISATFKVTDIFYQESQRSFPEHVDFPGYWEYDIIDIKYKV